MDVSHNALSGELSETLLKGTKDTAQYISIYMDNNGITGTIPLSLRRFSRLDLRLKDNRIEGIPPALCSQSNW